MRENWKQIRAFQEWRNQIEHCFPHAHSEICNKAVIWRARIALSLIFMWKWLLPKTYLMNPIIITFQISFHDKECHLKASLNNLGSSCCRQLDFRKMVAYQGICKVQLTMFSSCFLHNHRLVYPDFSQLCVTAGISWKYFELTEQLRNEWECEINELINLFGWIYFERYCYWYFKKIFKMWKFKLFVKTIHGPDSTH